MKKPIVMQPLPGGGSYLRNPDGTLTEVDPPTKPQSAVTQPAEPTEPAKEDDDNATA